MSCEKSDSKKISLREARDISIDIIRRAEKERLQIAEEEARIGINYEMTSRELEDNMIVMTPPLVAGALVQRYLMEKYGKKNSNQILQLKRKSQEKTYEK